MQHELSHAYIVVGSDGDARELAAAMLCEEPKPPCRVCAHCRKVLRGIHPDVITVKPVDNKKSLAVEQIREVTLSSAIAPNEASKRVFLIEDADKMNASCQNALLKLLEEPPKHIALILRAANPGELLPTVRSRCRVVYAAERNEPAPERVTRLADGFFSSLDSGAAELTRFSFELETMERQDFPAFFAELRRVAGEKARGAVTSGKISGEYLARLDGVIRELETYYEHNVSAAHIAAKLCAQFCEI